MEQLGHTLKAILGQESQATAARKAEEVAAALRQQKLSKAADLPEASGHVAPVCYGLPDGHWIKPRTNNPLERLMKEIRRRTRVIGTFPDGQSAATEPQPG